MMRSIKVEKRIVVLCPGPSLREMMMSTNSPIHHKRAGLVAVNRAIEVVRGVPKELKDWIGSVPVDEGEPWWWCFGDHVAHEMFSLRPNTPRPSIFCPSGVFKVWERRYPATWQAYGHRYGPSGKLEALFWDSLNPYNDDPPSGWRSKSGLAGIVLGVRLARMAGVRLVDVVGCDMTGNLDFKLERADGRAVERWRQERTKYNRIRRWAEKEGINVRRWDGDQYDDGAITEVVK